MGQYDLIGPEAGRHGNRLDEKPTEYGKKMQRDREAIQASCTALMGKFQGLMTFDDVEEWDREAQEIIQKLLSRTRGLDEEIERCRRLIASIEEERKGKLPVLRSLHARRENNDLQEIVRLYNEHRSAMELVIAELQESIDFSPNSPDEQKALLSELDLRKKELQFTKREIAANMRAVRIEARQQSANAGRFGIFYSSKGAAFERRQIRYAKESILRPQEDAKAAIERQLLQVERDIVWAKRFKRK